MHMHTTKCTWSEWIRRKFTNLFIYRMKWPVSLWNLLTSRRQLIFGSVDIAGSQYLASVTQNYWTRRTTVTNQRRYGLFSFDVSQRLNHDDDDVLNTEWKLSLFSSVHRTQTPNSGGLSLGRDCLSFADSWQSLAVAQSLNTRPASEHDEDSNSTTNINCTFEGNNHYINN